MLNIYQIIAEAKKKSNEKWWLVDLHVQLCRQMGWISIEELLKMKIPTLLMIAERLQKINKEENDAMNIKPNRRK